MSRKWQALCEDCGGTDGPARFRTIASLFLCPDCADFFTQRGRVHTPVERMAIINAREPLEVRDDRPIRRREEW